jgi:predicted RNA binding protein YcfA (HicA-like mRNA interferase family)
MPKLPRAIEVEKVLRVLGFVLIRQSGSHAIYKNTDGKRITLPVHGGKTISIGVFRSILKDIEINQKDFWIMK